MSDKKSSILSVDDFVVVPKSSLQSSRPSDEKEVKDDTSKSRLSAVSSMRGLFDPHRAYKFRIVAAPGGMATSSSQFSTSKVSWDPTGAAEFASLLALFGEYRVETVRFWLWPVMAGQLAAADQGKNPYSLMYGSDPAGIITGTPTDITVGSLAHTVRLTCAQRTTAAAVSKVTARGVSDSVLNLAPTKDGYISTSVAWPGQSCFTGAASVSGSVLQLAWQQEWVISLRARG